MCYSEDKLKKLVRRTAVLPLVHIHSVSGVWFNALDENEDFTPEAARFKDYITESCQSCVKGKPIQMWNHFDNEGPRTTDNVEGWHSKMNSADDHIRTSLLWFPYLAKYRPQTRHDLVSSWQERDTVKRGGNTEYPLPLTILPILYTCLQRWEYVS